MKNKNATKVLSVDPLCVHNKFWWKKLCNSIYSTPKVIPHFTQKVLYFSMDFNMLKHVIPFHSTYPYYIHNTIK